MPLLTKLKISGCVKQIHARPDRKTGFEKPATGVLALSFEGPDDCHSGLTRKSDSRTLALYKRGIDIRNVRQLTLVSDEELADIAMNAGIPAIQPEWFGCNIVTTGIPDLSLLPPSTRLQFPSGATIVVDMENMPCKQIADVVALHHPEVQFRLIEAARHKRGVTAWVEREGSVQAGDSIAIFIPPQRIYTHGS
jgi:MOSC domain